MGKTNLNDLLDRFDTKTRELTYLPKAMGRIQSQESDGEDTGGWLWRLSSLSVTATEQFGGKGGCIDIETTCTDSTLNDCGWPSTGQINDSPIIIRIIYPAIRSSSENN